MKLNKLETQILICLVLEYKQYIREDGTMVVRLTKALYGCIESAKLWHDDITGLLISVGFTWNDYDPCVLNKTYADEIQSTVMLHVDDLLITCKNEQYNNEIIDQLKFEIQGNECPRRTTIELYWNAAWL
jgi:hypothetical protein